MSRKASELDWGREVSPHLKPDEWPENVLDHLEARTVLTLSELREDVKRPAFPSPVYGAHVRHRVRSPGASNGDRHATDDDRRLSDATDFFVHWRDAQAYFRAVQRHPKIGGNGVYNRMMLRGTPGDFCMFHVDSRPERVNWVGDGREPVIYVMETAEPRTYFSLLAEMMGDAA